MEPFLHVIVLLVAALVFKVGFAGDELLACWPPWRRFKAFVRERLRGLFGR
jgi:hypothetical protein